MSRYPVIAAVGSILLNEKMLKRSLLTAPIAAANGPVGGLNAHGSRNLPSLGGILISVGTTFRVVLAAILVRGPTVGFPELSNAVLQKMRRRHRMARFDTLPLARLVSLRCQFCLLLLANLHAWSMPTGESSCRRNGRRSARKRRSTGVFARGSDCGSQPSRCVRRGTQALSIGAAGRGPPSSCIGARARRWTPQLSQATDPNACRGSS